MLDSIITFITDPLLLDLLQQWILAVTSVVTAASAVTALTPTKKDDKIRGFILSVMNFLALNIGNARNRDKEDA